VLPMPSERTECTFLCGVCLRHMHTLNSSPVWVQKKVPVVGPEFLPCDWPPGAQGLVVLWFGAVVAF
jgi:hypothetical protein